MNNNDDVIEILDDINEEAPSFNMQGPNISMSQNIYPQNNVIINSNEQQSVVENDNLVDTINSIEEVKYDPIESQKQEIKIEDEEEDDKSKSGLGFVIILFIILAVFIIALPYISKLIP